MALDERYIPLTLLNEYFVDKDTGQALANGTLSFYRDTARNTSKPVYQLTSNGGSYSYVALPNPVTLSAAGTAQDAAEDNCAIYAYPYVTDPLSGDLELDLYYIVCKDEDGVEQWTREAVPNLSDANDPVEGGTNTNQLSNPQFSQYFLIDEEVTLTLAGTQLSYPIAPDWDLVAGGTGTILLERVPVSGNEAIPTYPSYHLSMTISAGVTSPYLRQRLYQNSGIWSGQYLAGFFVGKVAAGSNAVTMKYKDENGTTSDVTVFSAALTQEWAEYGGSVLIGNSGNTQSGDDTYVDIVIELPTSNTIEITSIQVLVAGEDFPNLSEYDQRSANRELALMGDYYLPRLEYQNVSSLLYGWDFVKNPRQFGDTGTVTGATAEYIWDQTILQTVTGLTITYDTNAISNGLTLNHDVADKAFALIQYLDQEDAAKFVGTGLSVNVNGYTTAGGNDADDTSFYIKMFANASAAVFGTLPTSLVTVADDGEIALTAQAVTDGWYEITRNNLPTAKGVLVPLNPSSSLPSEYDIGFNNWQVGTTAQINAGVQGVAVVVSFVPTASTTDYNTCLDSISVTPGLIPTRPQNLSTTETLANCQKYYETSFSPGEVATATTTNAIYAPMYPFINATPAVQNNANGFGLRYLAAKRAIPSLEIYSGSSTTVGRITCLTNGTSATSSTEVVLASFFTALAGNGNKAFGYRGTTLTSMVTPIATSTSGSAGIIYHYVADARIGI